MPLRCLSVCLFLSLILLKPLAVKPQTLHYPKEAQFESNSFKILGRLKNHILVYTSYVLTNQEVRTLIYVFDTEMHLLRKTELNLPQYFNFLVSSDVIYLFYQQEEDEKLYLTCSALNDNGELIGPLQSVDLGSQAPEWRNRDYQVCYIFSNQDKSKIMVVQQPLKYSKSISLSTWLFDNQMHLEHRSNVTIPVLNWNEELHEFNLDNDGNLVFLRISKQADRNTLFMKEKDQDTVSFTRFLQPGVFINNNVKLKINDANQSYVVFANCFKKKHSTESGIYLFAWDKKKRQPTVSTKTFFPETKRGDDLVIHDIKFKKRNGYLVEALSIDPEHRLVLKNIKLVDFDSTGNMNWAHYIKYTEAKDAGIGIYNTFASDTSIYYFYEQLLKNGHSYISVQGIDASGVLQDAAILKSRTDAYPNISKGMQISADEFLLPFQDGTYTYIGILKF